MQTVWRGGGDLGAYVGELQGVEGGTGYLVKGAWMSAGVGGRGRVVNEGVGRSKGKEGKEVLVESGTEMERERVAQKRKERE